MFFPGGKPAAGRARLIREGAPERRRSREAYPGPAVRADAVPCRRCPAPAWVIWREYLPGGAEAERDGPMHTDGLFQEGESFRPLIIPTEGRCLYPGRDHFCIFASVSDMPVLATQKGTLNPAGDGKP